MAPVNAFSEGAIRWSGRPVISARTAVRLLRFAAQMRGKPNAKTLPIADLQSRCTQAARPPMLLPIPGQQMRIPVLPEAL